MLDSGPHSSESSFNKLCFFHALLFAWPELKIVSYVTFALQWAGEPLPPGEQLGRRKQIRHLQVIKRDCVTAYFFEGLYIINSNFLCMRWCWYHRFSNFLVLSWWKNLNPSFSLLPSTFENPLFPVTRFKDPKAAILKMPTGRRLWFSWHCSFK